MASKSGTLDRDDLIKAAIGLGIAVSGAALTYISEWVTATDFGSATPIVVAAFSVLANLARKLIKDNTPA